MERKPCRPNAKTQEAIDMKFICAWCKGELREPTDTDVELVSHGICEECKCKMLQGAFENINFSRPGVFALAGKN